MPRKLFDIMWSGVEQNLEELYYARVVMKLEEMLEGEFFERYIKIGKC